MKYIRIYTESKSMNNYYYEEQTGYSGSVVKTQI